MASSERLYISSNLLLSSRGSFGPTPSDCVATRGEPISLPRCAPFFHRKRAFGAVPNDREFVEEYYG